MTKSKQARETQNNNVLLESLGDRYRSNFVKMIISVTQVSEIPPTYKSTSNNASVKLLTRWWKSSKQN